MPKMRFLMIDGQGDPNNSKDFQGAIQALYSVVYGLKFARKKAGQDTFSVGALEGLWWASKGKPYAMGKRQNWLWTLMIWLPDFVSQSEVTEMARTIQAKKPNPALAKLRLDNFAEGRVVQIMHIGPYANEQPSIDKMHELAAGRGLIQTGKHHEIYLGDPRRADPAKLRTIVRHPVGPEI